MDKEWILPRAIDFDQLKGKALEECAYWLLDSMGARDLEWRVGGTGLGAADGGRDLTASFFAMDQSGSINETFWWIECKGRSRGTIQSSTVKDSVNNALANDQLTHFVLVTNTLFSNPTRDWISRWQERFPQPRILLWDQPELARLLSKHPEVAARLFPEALTPVGLLKVIDSRFWHNVEFAAPDALEKIWQAKRELSIEPLQLFALCASEFAQGSIELRPWATISITLDVLGHPLFNFGYLMLQADRAGVNMNAINKAFAYLVLNSLLSFDPKAVAEVIISSHLRDQGIDHVVSRAIILPMVVQIITDIEPLCTGNCDRVVYMDRQGIQHWMNFKDGVVTHPGINYWRRFGLAHKKTLAEVPRERLVYINNSRPCKVGYDVGCPFFSRQCERIFQEPLEFNALEEFLTEMQRITKYRMSEARRKMKAPGRAKSK